MSDDLYQEYETWDLTQPIIPIHSHLFNIDPIGMFSPYTESLTSYIYRLAEVHCVSVGILIKKLIRPNFHRSKNSSIESFQNRANSNAINGVGVQAANFIDILETLTLRKDLCYLTLYKWQDVFPWLYLIREIRAWCPKCLALSSNSLYEPLLWSVRVVNICLYHQEPLMMLCPRCNKQQRVLDGRSRIGYCSKCNNSLGDNAPSFNNDVRIYDKKYLEWEIWVASNIGNIIALTPYLESFPQRSTITEAINVCVEKITKGNNLEFASLIEVDKNQITIWRRGSAIPNLPALLKICYVSGISLLEFLTQTTNPPSYITPSSIPFKTHITKQSKTRVKFDVSKIESFLQNALLENPSPSLSNISKRIGHSEKTLRVYFFDLCKQITARHYEFKKGLTLKRKLLGQAETKRIVLDMKNKGIYPSQDLIKPLLTYPYYLTTKEGRQYLAQVRSELNITSV